MAEQNKGASAFHHIELNVSNLHKSREFYEPIMEWLGWKFHYVVEGCRGWRKDGCGFYLVQTDARFRDAGYHRKRTGLAHVAFTVPTHQEVDRFTDEVLKPRGIPTLYKSPMEDANYENGYRTVYFEDPDRIKIEIVHSNDADGND